MVSVKMLLIKVLILVLFEFSASASAAVCTTPICHYVASDVLGAIDPSINPCDDFYKFACGGLFKKSLHGKPMSLDALVADEVASQIKVMLQEPAVPSEPKAVQGLKKFFKACMDEATIERSGLTSIKNALKQLGGWPVLEGPEWTESDFRFEELLVKLRKLGLKYDHIFYFGISSDQDRIVIGSPLTAILEVDDGVKLHDLMVGTAVLLGANQQQAETELSEALQFKKRLFEIASKVEESTKTTFKNYQEQFPSLNWLKFVNEIRLPNQELSESNEGYFPSLNYVRDLENLLEGTSNRTLANYIIWEAIEEAIPYLPKAFGDLKASFDGSKEEKNRFSFCKESATKILPPTLETMYVTKYFSPERRKAIREIALLVNEEFLQLLNGTDLYDEETKSKALAKAAAVKHIVGGPEELFHKEGLAEAFGSDVNLETTDFLAISTTMNRLKHNHKLKFGASMTDDSYSEYATVNGFYNGLDNSMVIPAAIMQGPYFDEKRPQFMNFGTLGMLVGHEMMHGFAEEGHKDDNMWSKETAESFRQKSECIIQQAGSFEIEGSDLHMDGKKTLEETVCDYNGVEVAHRAYESWVKAHGAEKQLPGLNYTPKQLFWVSTASFFCDTVAADKLSTFLEEDQHGHPAFRIFGALSNNKHFGSDFNCPVGSRMNPSAKCQIF